MTEEKPPSRLSTVLIGIAFVAILIGGMALFSIGLDWLGDVLIGGLVEKLMNVGYSAIMWILLVMVVGAVIFGKRSQ